MLWVNYIRSLNEYVSHGRQVMWVDESNFNLFCRRNCGRSKAGTRVVVTLPASRGPNVHLIALKELLVQWTELGNHLADLVVDTDNAPVIDG